MRVRCVRGFVYGELDVVRLQEGGFCRVCGVISILSSHRCMIGGGMRFVCSLS
jgi:hypothetical protein